MKYTLLNRTANTVCLLLFLCLSLLSAIISAQSSLTAGNNDLPTTLYAHIMGKFDDGLFIAGGIINSIGSTNGDGYFLNLSTITATTTTTDINNLQWQTINLPTVMPTAMPSGSPSLAPSNIPSTNPSAMPTFIDCTTVNLTQLATNSTIFEFCAPTYNPSTVPSQQPSTIPTIMPSNNPTGDPSASPTYAPVINATTASPSLLPSSTPSFIPTVTPSAVPTYMPITPSEETFMGQVYAGQLSFVYKDKVYVYDEDAQHFLILRQLSPFNVTATSNISSQYDGYDYFPIDNVCVTHSDNKEAAYVVGNYNETTIIIQYDLETDTWQPWNYWTALEQRVENAFCVFANSKIYLFGGYLPSSGQTTNQIVRFRFNKDQWLDLSAGQSETLEEARYDGQSQWIGDYIILLGGNYREEVAIVNSTEFDTIEYTKQNTEVFQVSTEHLLGYGPDLAEEVELYASYWDATLEMLFVTGGITSDDTISSAWSYFDLRDKDLRDFMIIPTSTPTQMPTDPTCIEDEFAGFTWPETVMYQYAELACEFGYRGSVNQRYCNFYETWDNEVIWGCFAMSWTEDWDAWSNSSWTAISGATGNDPTDGSEWIVNGELQLSYDLVDGDVTGDPDVVRSRLTQPLPGRFFITVHRDDAECNNFIIAWGADYSRFAAESFRLSWDCYLGAFQLSNSTYINYDFECFEDVTTMEVIVSVYPDGYVTVETDADCQDVSIWVLDMKPLSSNDTVGDTYLFLTTDASTGGQNRDEYDSFDQLLARFGSIHFTQFFSNFDTRGSQVWDDAAAYQALTFDNDYLVLLAQEDEYFELEANISWYEFNTPMEARVGIVDSNEVSVNNMTFGKKNNIYLQYFLFGDTHHVDVKNLNDDNFVTIDEPYVAIVYDSVATQSRRIYSNGGDTVVNSTDCDWSAVSTDSGDDGTLSHEVVVTIDSNGLLVVTDELCGRSFARHGLTGTDQTHFSLGIYYNDDIVTQLEEELETTLNSNVTNDFLYTLFDYVDVIQLAKDEEFVTTAMPTPQPITNISFSTTGEADIGSVLSSKNAIIVGFLCIVWNLLN